MKYIFYLLNLAELPDVFLWKDKILSAVALVSLNFISFTLIFSTSGIVYLTLNFLLFFTIVSLCYVRLIAFVNNIPVIPEDDEDYAFISEQTMKNLWTKFFSTYDKVMKEVKGEENVDSNLKLKVIGGLILAALLGDLWSIYVWILLIIDTIFVMTYLHNEKQIDCCEKCHEYTNMAKNKIEDVLRNIPKYSDIKQD